MLKSALLILVLSSIGCGTTLPAFPDVYQCAYSDKFQKFVCYSTQTSKRLDRSLQSPIMEGAQCLSPDDYAKSQAWVESVIEIAERKCSK